MAKIAYLFPGQGSQYPGMGKEFYNSFDAARDAFAEADDALGFALSEMCFSGSEADLQLTANTQPAILTTSIASFRAFISAGAPQPDFVAGHSLGEYSALVSVGAFSLADAAAAVRKRGTYMQEAVPVGVGAMAAILGLDLETVEAGCAEAADGGVCSPANINSGSQIVIAGNADAVERACEILKEKGAKRAIMLNVSAPFHCKLMMPAQERLGADLLDLPMSEFSIPVVHNVDSLPNTHIHTVADKLTRQVSSPVRWLQTIDLLIAEGVDTFVEIGPGKVLSGLLRQIDRGAVCYSVENKESLNNTLEKLSL